MTESVATQGQFEANSETLWHRIIFYEEVPGRSPFLLRGLIPRPMRTEPHRSALAPGSSIRCTYKRGYLMKRITAVEPPSLIQFEVIEQHLGIERYVALAGGSYKICQSGSGTNVVLTTIYEGYLRPRWLWREFEELVLHQLHGYILGGMGNPMSPVITSLGAPASDYVVPKSID